MAKDRLIMAFESSADETSVAIVRNGSEIVSLETATQIKSHQRFGGIVPEVASRHHIEQVTILAQAALEDAQVTYDDLDAVAVTQGPGLVGALLIGVTAAKTIAWAHNLPIVPVIHLAGHISAANFVEPIQYPALALMVSGGHTELVLMREEYDYLVIGDTRDDAAGEAYDKVGRTMGLKYPSGKIIDDMAHQGTDTYNLPRAMLNEDNFDFSFSGIKSAVINLMHNADQRGETIDLDDLASSFQAAVVEILVGKAQRALEAYPVKSFIVAGGVAANRGLRDALASMMQRFPDTEYIPVPIALAGDNAAMIGAAGDIAYRHGARAGLDLNANPALEFDYLED
ncbi:tRNA (adenosine(37)-N6)-threonylcarbamoyltransferase complex transferase subunit TsaD [Weissella viridescens]|uniref:tRNA (adenosine(37)-N6)-threonylcarbamoyltransferase complex transferase subunit TsaD n=1 Tax=Weissella viridescens TaxID=1629 RepID=UPI001D0695A1|nr:tRNA (adenosine(37)-N6)-threonylcarbamoyltransferase complex transferase subunit TsaD [Weissella viridescens]MCB6840305.1 tRNA (adenosine(37)-N6)-threonylcarbamoyltransferase complex transferase subunit TsaD [Weissella viridescens]MCB6847037.1 tRNA (adenosine(37)-N6)-threonylcarbamoyltransferase complex transferase subunit TsaD [Weissella viridescens]WJI91330.1 tRNA (adenosine(37)-N6)-threonylcarbamoyltransferase complex transferase subunit TsaD [Weissella viridescens]